MHCHCGTNNRAPRWTFTDPCKPEVRPGAREESASPAWLAAPAMNVRDTTKVYIWRLDTGCRLTLYRKCHSHNTPGKSTKVCSRHFAEDCYIIGAKLGTHQRLKTIAVPPLFNWTVEAKPVCRKLIST